MSSIARTLRPLARAATASSRRSLRPAVARATPQYAALPLSDLVQPLIDVRRIRCLSSTAPRRDAAVDISDIPPTPITHLSETEAMMGEAVAKFASEVILPKAREMDEAETMDPAVVEQLFEQGLMGIEIPEEYGGSGMNFTAAIIAIEELARVDPSVSVMCDVHNTLVNTAILKWGSEAIKKKYLPRLASDTVGSFCLSEPVSGSDAFALATKATRTASGGYKISGSKMWITNSMEADFFIVFANLAPEKKYKGITAFIVEKGTKGFSIAKKEKKLGIKASSTCVINFDDVEIPAENLLGEEGHGYKYAIGLLNEGRIGIAAQMTGLALGAFENAAGYVFLCFPLTSLLGRQHTEQSTDTSPDTPGTTASNSASSSANSKACSTSSHRHGWRSAPRVRSSTTRRARRRQARTLSWTPPWPNSTLHKSPARCRARQSSGWAAWALCARAWRRSTSAMLRLAPSTRGRATSSLRLLRSICRSCTPSRVARLGAMQLARAAEHGDTRGVAPSVMFSASRRKSYIEYK